MKNYFTVALGVVAFIAGALAWHYRQENARLLAARDRLTQQLAAVNRLTTTARTSPSTGKAAPAAVAADSTADTQGQRSQDFRRRRADWANDPERQKERKDASMRMISRRYSDLFRRLGLGEEGTAMLISLMADERPGGGGFNRFGGGFGSSDNTDQAEQARIEKSIAELLGPDKYALYQNYQNTLPQRNSVDELNQRLNYSGTPLSPEDSDKLVTVMASAEQNFSFSVNPLTMSADQLATISDSQIDTYVNQRKQLDAQILQQAQSVLNENQLELLADQQMQNEDRLKTQLTRRREFAARRLNANSTNTTASAAR